MAVVITGSNTPTAGGVTYGDGTTYATTAAGSSGQVLTSAGASAPTWSAVSLTTGVSGTLPIANGGTNSTATPTAGGIVYGDGSAHQITAAGTSGQILQSNGASAPSWVAAPGGGSWIYLSTVTASGAATADIETTFSSTYDAYAIVATNMYSSTYNVDLQCQLKISGTYQTSSYGYTSYGMTANSASIRVIAVPVANQILLNSPGGGEGGMNSSATLPGMFTLYTQTPSSTSTYKLVSGQYSYVPGDGGTRFTTCTFGGRYTGAAGALTGVRIFTSSGTIYGTFRLYGIKNS